MRKKIILTILVLFILSVLGVIYLNRVILPVKIKSLIVTQLQDLTGKKVRLQTLQFNIFKGLVLRDLTIYDDEKTYLELKEGSCTFIIWPIFKKTVIIPALKFKSPEVFIKRRKDNTLDTSELFLNMPGKKQKSKFNISVYNVIVTGATVHFQDEFLTPALTKTVRNLNLNISLSLPASVRFKFKSEISADPSVKVSGGGTFRIPQNELTAGLLIKDFSPRDFLGYYQNLGVNITSGSIDSRINLKFKDRVISADLQAENKNILFDKNKVSVKLNSQVESEVKYFLEEKRFDFAGSAKITDTGLYGLDFAEEVKDINGELEFSNSGIRSQKLLANIWGLPVEARASLTGFQNPLLKISIGSSLGMDSVQGILKDKFKFIFPGVMSGDSRVSLDLESREGILNFNGLLDILNATVKLEKMDFPFEEVDGRIEFSQNRIKWDGLNFKYSKQRYKAAGELVNFQLPEVRLALDSENLSLRSDFGINRHMVNFSNFSGEYFNSKFSVQGTLNTSVPEALEAEARGALDIALEDMQGILKKYKVQLEEINPSGKVHAKFDFSGNINDFKSCAVNAEFSGSSVSAYGLKANDFFFNYTQKDGLIDVPLARLSLYDGAIEATAKMNLNSDNLPYWLDTNIRGVKLEKLKADTKAKDKDIAGTIQAQFKLNGFFGNLSKLSGAGSIFISEGKLWELNLFKGLGSLLFAKDFANIVFSEGSCGFSIQDKYVFTDNLKLKSTIANLSGSTKIGFDGSIDASLNVQVLDNLVPLSGTFKDVTTAIIGEAGRFGIIRISGTLKEPKYKFRPAVGDIIKGLKKAIFGD